MVGKSVKTKVVGISTSTETYKCGLKIASFVKKLYPEVIIVMGGCHVSFEYEDAFNSGYVDYVIRNEGEVTFKELLDYIYQGKGELYDIDGLCYVDAAGHVVKNKNRKYIENLDELPIPDRTFFEMEKYAYPASISTSRGCPGNCIFCAATALSGGRYRIRSASNIIKEIKYLKELGYSHVQIVDDTMTADVERLVQFIDLMIKENLQMSWYCESRADIMTKELLQKMKEAGCCAIQFGVEAGSQEMLDCLRKNVTMEQIRNVFKWAHELDLVASSCLIIGQPYDTKQTINETMSFAKELKTLGASIVFSVSTPYPGTYMYNNPDKLGLEILDFDTDNYTTQIPVYNSKYLTKDEIQSAYFDAVVSLSQTNMSEEEKSTMDAIKNILREETLGEEA